MDTSDPQAQLPADDQAPTGGSDTTEDELESDNAVEDDTIAAVAPGGSPE